MKKQTINFSWPATLSNFSADSSNEKFTRGKLKVFYKGETADHRYFSDEFSEEVVKSLPYTPVVSYYDEEKDDFVGHATEQAIYGMVDPCVAPTFETDEEGKTWCVCDVVLYTERPGKVGKIASKIVGHKQSLELDPKTVKYTVNYDEKRHFKNIEFTAGSFIGVSVLGNDQKPAFTGSGFFAYDEQFEAKMKTLREYCETNAGHVDTGGESMNLQEFMKLSWGDISSKVDNALMASYGEEAFTYIVDMFEDSAIVRFYSYIDGSITLNRVYYSVNEAGEVTLGNVNEVHITYEDVVPQADATTVAAAAEETGVEQAVPTVQAEETSPEEAATATITEDAETLPESAEIVDSSAMTTEEEVSPEATPEVPSEPAAAAETSDAANEAAQVTNAEVTDVTIPKVSVVNENPTEAEGSSSTSFTESERAELESLRRQEKIQLIEASKDQLEDEDYDQFMAAVDNFSKEELAVQILSKHCRSKRVERAFAFAPVLEPKKASTDALDDWVKNNL